MFSVKESKFNFCSTPKYSNKPTDTQYGEFRKIVFLNPEGLLLNAELKIRKSKREI